MDTHEVVVKEMERKSRLKAREAPRERVGESSKPTHIHAHGQVLSFNQIGQSTLLDRVSRNGDKLSTDNTFTGKNQIWKPPK